MPQVAFKDGPTGSWPSKGNHFKEYRRKRSEEMVKRQRDRYGTPGVIPNFEGKEAPSWSEAQDEARYQRGAESAATFDARVTKEKLEKVSLK